ncbi:hypothetical protein [Actinokineospora inagensis]|uniref:hypothetical protein n=1 Tax=Actinokineospora inagensis TaxID=103730 RepID=UPI0003FD9E28|nr:hypothetical protein [Actinokineospora inagensis]
MGTQPGESEVSIFRRLPDDTAVTAPLSEEDVAGLSGNQLGDWVHRWLQDHTF